MISSLRIKLARYVATAALVLVPMLVPVAVHAQTNVNIQGDACSGANIDLTGGQANGCGDTATNTVSSLLKKVIDIFSLIVGAVSVIMIIIGGFRYIISGGESSNVSGAKNTIIFAIVGLVIVVLAQILVQFVLAKTSGAINGS
jgi:cytochrome bd-type quinol oxidase subunit 2